LRSDSPVAVERIDDTIIIAARTVGFKIAEAVPIGPHTDRMIEESQPALALDIPPFATQR